MLINCENCDHKYDTDDYEECPNCGDDNEDQIEEMEGEN